jgi:hypothetical protein
MHRGSRAAGAAQRAPRNATNAAAQGRIRDLTVDRRGLRVTLIAVPRPSGHRRSNCCSYCWLKKHQHCLDAWEKHQHCLDAWIGFRGVRGAARAGAARGRARRLSEPDEGLDRLVAALPLRGQVSLRPTALA